MVNLCMSALPLQDVQVFVKDNLNLLWDEYKRLKMPEEYPVDLSQACWENKMSKIQEIKETVSL